MIEDKHLFLGVTTFGMFKVICNKENVHQYNQAISIIILINLPIDPIKSCFDQLRTHDRMLKQG